MNFGGKLIRVVLLAGMMAGMGQVRADVVPGDVQGIYNGTVKTTAYYTGKPEKSTESAVIIINESSWEIQIGPTSLKGNIAAKMPYLFGSAFQDTAVVGGRLQVKGKPGKQQLLGKLTMGTGSQLGMVDVTLKAKKAL